MVEYDLDSLREMILCGGMKNVGDRVKKFTQSYWGTLMVGGLSSVMSILVLMFLYTTGNGKTYSGINSFALNAVGARNALFVSSIVMGVSALGAVVAKVAGSFTAGFYRSALTVFTENYLHTTVSVIVVAGFFLVADIASTHDDYWMLVVSVICGLVLKALMEVRHSDYMLNGIADLGLPKPSDADQFKVQTKGGLLASTALALYTTIAFASTTNWGNYDTAAGSVTAVLLFLALFIVALFVQPKDGIFGSGLNISQVILGVNLAFAGWLLAKNQDSKSLVVVLGVLYLDGLQIGKLQKGEKVSSGRLIGGLFLAVQFFLGLMGLVGLNVNEKLTVKYVHDLNATAGDHALEANKGNLEALTTILYGVAIASSLVKILSPWVGVGGDFLEIRSPSPRQVFRKFSSTGLLLASSVLWLGGADFVLGENAVISTSFATALFVFALLNRFLESFIDSTVDDSKFAQGLGKAAMDYVSWTKADSDSDENVLDKTSFDNVRTWMVIGALSTSFGLLVRYGEQTKAIVWDGDASTQQGYFQAAYWLVLGHLVLACVCVLGDIGRVSMLKSIALSRSSAARFIVSTTAICALVITTAETGTLIDTTTSITTPDSAENNIIGALVAYVLADALGAEFL